MGLTRKSQTRSFRLRGDGIDLLFGDLKFLREAFLVCLFLLCVKVTSPSWEGCPLSS